LVSTICPSSSSVPTATISQRTASPCIGWCSAADYGPSRAAQESRGRARPGAARHRVSAHCASPPAPRAARPPARRGDGGWRGPEQARERAGRESLGALLAQLAHALLARGCARLPLVLVNRIIASCALIALVSPLLLWISWSRTGFFIILATAAVAVGIIHLLVWLYPDDPF
jgi:hypothetical protein